MAVVPGMTGAIHMALCTLALIVGVAWYLIAGLRYIRRHPQHG
jgi:hypothetical protein